MTMGDAPRRPLRVALTGGIATGKSQCLARCAARGVPTIDADVAARDAVRPGSPGLRAVVARFGADVLHPDGSLNREVLGARVFSDADARRDLEAIVHPSVYAAIGQWFESLAAPFGVADIPLLFETGREGDFDVVIVAACRPEQQLERLMARSGLTDAAARARIAAQWPIDAKVARADHVIDTSGTLADTEARTDAALEWLDQRATTST